jgi:hypothetical protein
MHVRAQPTEREGSVILRHCQLLGLHTVSCRWFTYEYATMMRRYCKGATEMLVKKTISMPSFLSWNPQGLACDLIQASTLKGLHTNDVNYVLKRGGLFILIKTVQSEHKNTPRFQAVIKSKLTGIFLQNWWLQLHKPIQFYVVWNTLNVHL